jgi:hypothetical protein
MKICCEDGRWVELAEDRAQQWHGANREALGEIH